jgi:hypothetical protein
MTTFVLIIAYLHTVVFRSFLMRACCSQSENFPLDFCAGNISEVGSSLIGL